MKRVLLAAFVLSLPACSVVSRTAQGVSLVRVSGGVEARNYRAEPLTPVILTISGPGLSTTDPRCTLIKAEVRQWSCDLTEAGRKPLLPNTARPALFSGTASSGNLLYKVNGQFQPPAFLN